MKSTVFATPAFVFVIALLYFPFFAHSKTNIDDNADDNYDLDEFDTIIATYMRERRIPGASVAVAKNGRFLVSKGYGRASVQRLMTPWALVRIGSISKVVTSVAVMKLVEEGRVQLQTRVFGATGLLTEHSPVSDDRILNITVLDLLQHSSGWDHRLIGDPLFMPSLHRVRPVENVPSSSHESAAIKDNIVRFMMNQTLQYKPGTRYSYSNFGYTVLGLVIERVSGRKYEQFMRDLLRKTGIYRMKLVGARRSDVDIFEVQYFARDDPFASNTGSSADRTVPPSISVTADRLNMAALDSSSGWIATAADLVRLMESLAGSVSISVRENPTATAGSAQHSILQPETVLLMLTRPKYSVEPILPSPTSSTSSQSPSKSSMPTSSKAWYGLGLVVEDGGQTFWHSGTLEDSTGVVAHDGISGFTWSALLNCRLEPTNDLGDFMRYAVRQVFFGWTSLTPTQLSPSAGSSSSSISVPAARSDQQHDSSGVDHHLVGRSAASNVVRSNDVVIGDGDDDDVAGGAKPGMMTSPLRLALARLVDTLSADGRTAVKLMVADYRVEELVNSLGTFGYRPTWLDAYDYRGQIFFNVIWTRNEDSFRWRIYFDLTPSRYRKRFRARVVQGFRLSHVETYVSRRKMRFAAIFVRDTWPEWTAYEGVSTQRHRAEYYRHLRDGYRLVVQSVTEYQGQLYVAAIYDKLYLGDSRVRLGLSVADFSDELERQLAAGRVMSYVQAYEHRGLVRFSAVWTPKTTRHWAASHAMSKYTTLNKLVDYSSINVPLVSIAAYVDDDGGLYFAALWR